MGKGGKVSVGENSTKEPFLPPKKSSPRTVAFDDLLKVGARTEIGDNTQGIADRVGCQRVQRRVWSNHSIPVGPGGM